jgi:hypothetical protein
MDPVTAGLETFVTKSSTSPPWRAKAFAALALAIAPVLTLDLAQHPFAPEVALADPPAAPPPAAAVTDAPSPAAPLLSGKLRCIGKNKEGEDTYTGEVYVIPFKDIYLVTWDISGSIHIGQAIERDGHLAVIYLNADKSHYGIALYQKKGEDWLGTWVGVGNDTTAGELWTR